MLGAVTGALDALVTLGNTATYGYFSAHVGLHPHSTELWGLLGAVVELDSKAGNPLRSSLIVNATSLKPGAAYYEAAKKFLPPDFLPDEKAEEAFWIGHLHRLGINAYTMHTLSPIY